MQQRLPLLLDWLSTAPDPDLGLLGLRRLADGPTRAMELANALRDSPETARRPWLALGPSARLTGLLVRTPDMVASIGATDHPEHRSIDSLVASAHAAIDGR